MGKLHRDKDFHPSRDGAYLPSELLVSIATYCENRDLINVMMTCRHMYEATLTLRSDRYMRRRIRSYQFVRNVMEEHAKPFRKVLRVVSRLPGPGKRRRCGRNFTTFRTDMPWHTMTVPLLVDIALVQCEFDCRRDLGDLDHYLHGYTQWWEEIALAMIRSPRSADEKFLLYRNMYKEFRHLESVQLEMITYLPLSHRKDVIHVCVFPSRLSRPIREKLLNAIQAHHPKQLANVYHERRDWIDKDTMTREIAMTVVQSQYECMTDPWIAPWITEEFLADYMAWYTRCKMKEVKKHRAEIDAWRSSLSRCIRI